MKSGRAAASVLGRDAVRELDERTIAAGTPSLELMERAGRAIADALADEAFHGVHLPDEPRLLVVAGRGSNGGDGFVVARLLAEQGWDCTVVLACGEPDDGTDADTNFDLWRAAGGRVIEREEAVGLLASGAADFDLGLDAVFGTGLARAVEGADAELIAFMNSSGLPFVAADIPSGLSSDGGVPLGAAVRARATVAIGAAKPGHFLDEGPDHCGRVRVADIGLLPPVEHTVVGVVLDESTTRGMLPRLSTSAHKGQRGRVLVVAGSRGKTGAAILAAHAALRAGAGLVTVASVMDVQDAVSASLPEAMTIGLIADESGQIAPSAAGDLGDAIQDADAVVVGPGLGKGVGINLVVEAAFRTTGQLILDADALNAISEWDVVRRRTVFEARAEAGHPKPILTPHPGEMARLIGQSPTKVQNSRKLFAETLASELGAVVVLKGAATVVARQGMTAFNLSGNPGMATAGMGDVLAGITGALSVALGDPFDAACLAVWVHGRAADELYGFDVGFLASDIAQFVPHQLASRRPR